jgi:putative spermidine/putrescine transport system permease protein
MSAADPSRRLRQWLLLIIVPLLVFGVLYCAPILNLLRLSFATFDPHTGSGHGFRVDTYTTLLSDDYFLLIVWRTVRLSLLTTLACALFGYPVSMVVAQSKGWAQTGLFIVLLMPLMTSVTVTTYGWLILLGQSGVVNSSLLALGLIDRPVRLLQSETAIVVGLTHVLCVFMVISIAAALQAIDPNHIRAARSLGASPWASFWRIVFPQGLPGLRTGCLLVFSLSMSSYATPGVLGGPRLKFVSFLIYQQAIQLLDWSRAASMAVLLLVVTTGVLGLASAYGQIAVWRRARRNRIAAPLLATSGREEAA